MTEKTLLISFLLAFCFGQSDFQKGVTHYNKRHEGCIEDRAKPMQIEMAITYFENVLSNKTNKKEMANRKRNLLENVFMTEEQKLKVERLKGDRDGYGDRSSNQAGRSAARLQ